MASMTETIGIRGILMPGMECQPFATLSFDRPDVSDSALYVAASDGAID
jgi:hypothetical protein